MEQVTYRKGESLLKHELELDDEPEPESDKEDEEEKLDLRHESLDTTGVQRKSTNSSSHGKLEVRPYEQPQDPNYPEWNMFKATINWLKSSVKASNKRIAALIHSVEEKLGVEE